MNTISVVIITFNEEQKTAQCLDYLQDIADEIVVVDLGSFVFVSSYLNLRKTTFA